MLADLRGIHRLTLCLGNTRESQKNILKIHCDQETRPSLLLNQLILRSVVTDKQSQDQMPHLTIVVKRGGSL